MPSVPYARFASEVLEIYALRSPATLCKMRQVLREFGELPGVERASDLKPVTIARWIAAHQGGRSPATTDSLLRSMKSAVALGLASGYLKLNPFAAKVPVPDFDPSAEGKRRHHSVAEVNRVLALATAEAAGCDWHAGRLEALVYLAAFCALRKHEAIFLHRDDVDLVRRTLLVNPARRRLKTRASAAPVPMPRPLADVLGRWLPRARSEWVVPNVSRARPWDGGPPGGKALDRVKQLGARAGVAGLTLLSFRHSWATHARAWGLSDLMIQAVLRHTNTRTQRHYFHPDADDLAAAAARVGYAAPPPPPAGLAAG